MMQTTSKQDLSQCLTDAGLPEQSISELLEQPIQRQRAMIEAHRKTLLNELHSANHKLECLDYYRYQYLTSSKA